MWGEGDEDATNDGNTSSILRKLEPPSLASSEATKNDGNNMWGINKRPSSRPSSEKTATKTKIAEDDDDRHLCTCVFVCDCKERLIRLKRKQRLEKEREKRNAKALERLLSSHVYGIQQPLHEFLQEHGIQPPSLGKHDMRKTMPRPRPKQKNSSKARGKGKGKKLQKEVGSSIEVVEVVEEEEVELSIRADSGTALVARDVAIAAEAMADRMFKTMDELKKRDLVVLELQQLLQEYGERRIDRNADNNNNDDNDDAQLPVKGRRLLSLRTKQRTMKRTKKKPVPPKKGTTFGGFISRGGGSSASPPSSSSFSLTPSPPSTMKRSKSGNNLKHHFLKRSSKSVYMTTTTGQMASMRKEKSPTTRSDRAALRLAHASIW